MVITGVDKGGTRRRVKMEGYGNGMREKGAVALGLKGMSNWSVVDDVTESVDCGACE